jgi:hypothetical protein
MSEIKTPRIHPQTPSSIALHNILPPGSCWLSARACKKNKERYLVLVNHQTRINSVNILSSALQVFARIYCNSIADRYFFEVL